MTLAEIDDELAIWKKSLAAAAQNLMDLHSLPTYQRLAGTSGVEKAELTGITAQKVYPALEGMGKLFQNFDDLQSTIAHAVELRQNANSIFGSEAKLREIEAVLRGKSVRLSVEPLPIDQRMLATLTTDAKEVTPAELMGAMARSFTAARDVVTAVSHAWEKLGAALDDALTDLVELKANFPSMTNTESQIEAIRARIEKDPLGCAEEYDSSIEPVFRQARAALARIKAQRAQVETGLQSARKLQTELTDLHSQSVANCNERREKVTCSSEPVPPLEESKISALAEWLARLEQKFNEGMVEPILVGLEKWNKNAMDCVSHERACLGANQAPLLERNELRGRLEALKAKARAKNVAEHPELTRLAQEATEQLFHRPTPLDTASNLVVEYEKTLRTLKA